MKTKSILLFICIIYSLSVVCQEDNTIYYDENWKEISDKSEAHFYRKISESADNPKHFVVKDFYISGEIQMEAIYSSLDPEIKNGDAFFYYKNGQKQTKRFYIDNEENGSYQEWFPNGNPLSEGAMKNNEENGIWKYYYSDGKLRKEGAYANGYEDGVWKIYNLDEVYYLKYTYKNKLLSKAELIDDSKGYYEYFNDPDGTENSINPYFYYRQTEEFKATEHLIKKNIELLQTSVDFNVQNVIYPFTLLWVTNCPYLGKFEIYVGRFMLDYTTLDKSYKYAPLMTKMYTMGLASYFLDHGGNTSDNIAFHEAGATFMVNYYLNLKKLDSSQKNEKMEKLANLLKKGKLNSFIKKYK
jgi:antitoxin component YwqK of YwqJK toxin-antitoxin module